MCPLKLITWTENFDDFRNYKCNRCWQQRRCI